MNFSSEIRKTHGEIMEGQKYLHATGVNFRPRRDELPQVVGTKDRRISVGDFVSGKNVRTFILSYFIVQTKTNSGMRLMTEVFVRQMSNKCQTCVIICFSYFDND